MDATRARSGSVRRVGARWLLLLALWWVLSEGSASYLGYGLPAATLATWVSVRLAPVSDGGSWRGLLAVPGLVGWSFVQLVRGGVDVAARVLKRRVDVEPVVVTVDVSLPAGAAREFALGLMSLLPGTLVQATEDDRAHLHSLSPDLDAAGQWRELESRVRAVVGDAGS